MRDLAEGDYHAEVGKSAECDLEVRAACRDLARLGLVRRREAFDGVQDDRTGQAETVRWIRAILALSEPELQQRRVEQLAGIIASEGPAGTVGAVLARSKHNDRQPRVAVAERRHGRIPPIRKFDPAFLPERDQARAQRAVTRRFRLR